MYISVMRFSFVFFEAHSKKAQFSLFLSQIADVKYNTETYLMQDLVQKSVLAVDAHELGDGVPQGFKSQADRALVAKLRD